MCSTPLSVSGTKKQTVPLVNGNGGDKLEVVRLSFRKGGEKEAYRKMKSVLGMKAWERNVSPVGSVSKGRLTGNDVEYREKARTYPQLLGEL